MKIKLLLLGLLFTSICISQQGINYKAQVKDGNGNLVTNQSITIQFTILKGVAETNVYQETHTPTTNANVALGFMALNSNTSGWNNTHN